MSVEVMSFGPSQEPRTDYDVRKYRGKAQTNVKAVNVMANDVDFSLSANSQKRIKNAL